MDKAIHFVGFRGEEYVHAVRVWGRPDFIHVTWDRRAQREIMDGDTVVFATDERLRDKNSPDLPLERLEELRIA